MSKHHMMRLALVFNLVCLLYTLADGRHIDYNYMIDESVDTTHDSVLSMMQYTFRNMLTGYSENSIALWHEMRLDVLSPVAISGVRVNVSMSVNDAFPPLVSHTIGLARFKPDERAVVTLGPTLLYSGVVGHIIRSATVNVTFVDSVPGVRLDVKSGARLDGKSRQTVTVDVLEHYMLYKKTEYSTGISINRKSDP